MRLSTGRGRQAGKQSLSASCRFHQTSIAGLTWGVSRDSETLGPVGDLLGLQGGGVSPAISWPRIKPALADPAIRAPNHKARQLVLTSPVWIKDRVAEPDQMEAAGFSRCRRKY